MQNGMTASMLLGMERNTASRPRQRDSERRRGTFLLDAGAQR